MRILGTFPRTATRERITHVPRMTSTHRPLLVRPIITRLTPGIVTAGVRLTQVALIERSATNERIARHVSGTGTNGCEPPQLAVRRHSTNPIARVLANPIETGRFSAGAVAVSVALGLTGHQWVAEVVLGAFAHGSVVSDVTFRVFSTLGAWVLALELDTG